MVGAMRGILDRFQMLNPYDPELLAPWKVEHESLHRQLHCYVISAKRYALYRHDQGGNPEMIDTPEDRDDDPEDPAGAPEQLTDRSEHGLGLYMDPDPPEHKPGEEAERGRWISETWQWILDHARAHGQPKPKTKI